MPTTLSRRRLHLLAAAAIVGAASPAPAQVTPSYETFTLPGTDVTIRYPANIFRRTGPATGDEGATTFTSSDGRAEFSVGSQPIAPDWTMETLADAAESSLIDQGARGIFRRVEPNWYVFSGLFDDKIFYYKVVISDGGRQASSFQMSYPKSERSFYREVTAEMSKSFQPDTAR